MFRFMKQVQLRKLFPKASRIKLAGVIGYNTEGRMKKELQLLVLRIFCSMWISSF